MKSFFLLLTSSVFLTASYAQVANNSVETWRNYSAGFPATTLEAPVNWFGADSLIYTYAPLFSGTPQQVLYKDNNAHTGSFGVKLISKDLNGIVAPGLLANAHPELDFNNLDPNNPLEALSYDGGTLVNQRYNSLVAWVSYSPASNDVGVASVQAIKTGAGAGGADSVIGMGVSFLSAMPSYTEIMVPITYNDATTVPDKMIITFMSSDLSGENGTTPQDGSSLFVDDISLSMATDVRDVYTQSEIGKIYPNPADHVLNITAGVSNGLWVNVFNSSGALLHQAAFKNSFVLPLNNFSSGMYFYEIKDVKDKKVQRGSFSVIK